MKLRKTSPTSDLARLDGDTFGLDKAMTLISFVLLFVIVFIPIFMIVYKGVRTKTWTRKHHREEE